MSGDCGNRHGKGKQMMHPQKAGRGTWMDGESTKYILYMDSEFIGYPGRLPKASHHPWSNTPGTVLVIFLVAVTKKLRRDGILFYFIYFGGLTVLR